MVSAFAWSIKACGANTMIPSDGADFADEADLPVCAEQPVVYKPMAAKRDKSIFFIFCFVYIVLVFAFLFMFVLLGGKNCRNNCGKKLCQCHVSAENRLFVFLLYAVWHE